MEAQQAAAGTEVATRQTMATRRLRSSEAQLDPIRPLITINSQATRPPEVGSCPRSVRSTRTMIRFMEQLRRHSRNTLLEAADREARCKFLELQAAAWGQRATTGSITMADRLQIYTMRTAIATMGSTHRLAELAVARLDMKEDSISIQASRLTQRQQPRAVPTAPEFQPLPPHRPGAPGSYPAEDTQLPTTGRAPRRRSTATDSPRCHRAPTILTQGRTTTTCRR